jgi:hypothetical protein
MRQVSRWLWTSNAHPIPNHGFSFSQPVSAIKARQLIRQVWVDNGPARRMPSGFKLSAPVTQLLRTESNGPSIKTVDGIDILPFKVMR